MSLPLKVTSLIVRAASGAEILSVGDLSVAAGETLGVRGPSGAGKSTLLMALAGLAGRAAGQVRWGDTEILDASPARAARFRADNIGFVFQDFLLFEELGAQANAALPAMYLPRPDRDRIRSNARRTLERFGIGATADTVALMSGGERQRVAVARALSNDAAILLADEPTANLDRATSDRLVADMMDHVRDTGTTLILVSHDDAFLARMDRVLTLADGRLV